jgi:ribose/xylose/arabinose/galactoside ABC-type transport system permease subunit
MFKKANTPGIGLAGAGILQRKKKMNVGNYVVIIMLFGMFIFFTLMNSNFLSFKNIMNIMNQSTVYGIMALGELAVIITLGIDLSIASCLALTSVLMALLVQTTTFSLPFALAALIAILPSILVGLINGLTIAYLNVPSFIITLALGQTARGLAKLLVGGMAVVSDLPNNFNILGVGSILGIPYMVYIWLTLMIIMFIVMKYTRYGRHIYAIGGNRAAAAASGINVKKITTWIYIISGLMGGIAGVLMASRINSGTPTIANGYELQVVAAVVIGGVSLLGGVGSVWGTLKGVLVIGVLSTGMSMMNIFSYYQSIVQGLVITFAVILDIQTKKREREMLNE